MTVINHDDIIDFKRVAYFPEYAKVLSDKCYEETNDNAPRYSKSNKVKLSNVVQLMFIEEKNVVKNSVSKVDSSFLLLFWDY